MRLFGNKAKGALVSNTPTPQLHAVDPSNLHDASRQKAPISPQPCNPTFKSRAKALAPTNCIAANGANKAYHGSWGKRTSVVETCVGDATRTCVGDWLGCSFKPMRPACLMHLSGTRLAWSKQHIVSIWSTRSQIQVYVELRICIKKHRLPTGQACIALIALPSRLTWSFRCVQ